jgi:hypothetical protein
MVAKIVSLLILGNWNFSRVSENNHPHSNLASIRMTVTSNLEDDYLNIEWLMNSKNYFI